MVAGGSDQGGDCDDVVGGSDDVDESLFLKCACPPPCSNLLPHRSTRVDEGGIGDGDVAERVDGHLHG